MNENKLNIGLFDKLQDMLFKRTRRYKVAIFMDSDENNISSIHSFKKEENVVCNLDIKHFICDTKSSWWIQIYSSSIYNGELLYHTDTSDTISEQFGERILTIDNFNDEYYMDVLFDEMFNYIDILYDIHTKICEFSMYRENNQKNMEQLIRDKKLKDIEKI